MDRFSDEPAVPTTEEVRGVRTQTLAQWILLTVLMIGLIGLGVRTLKSGTQQTQQQSRIAALTDSLGQLQAELSSLHQLQRATAAELDTARMVTDRILYRVSLVNSDLTDLTVRIQGERYLTSEDLQAVQARYDQRLDALESQLGTVARAAQDLRPWVQSHLDMLAASQSAEVERLRASIDHRFAGQSLREGLQTGALLTIGGIVVTRAVNN